MANGIYRYTPRKVRKQGVKDGRDWRWKPWRPFPGWPLWEKKDPVPLPISQRSSQYEETLRSDALANLSRVAEQWAQKDDKLLDEYSAAKSDLEQLEAKHGKEIKEYENTLKPLEEARAEFEKFPPRWIPLWLFWTIFGVITIGEGFFNYFVFQMFGEREWQTALMAAAIILVIPLSSELLGHFLKKDEKSPMDKLFMALSVMTIVALLIGLAILRETFFEVNLASEQRFPLTPAKLALILILFNLAIFVILTFLSYSQARREPEAYRRARDKYNNLLKASTTEQADVKTLDPVMRKAVERLSKAEARRISLFKEYQSAVEKERNSWISYIRTYRHANETARINAVEIVSFHASPEDTIPIPPKLKELHWECVKSDIQGGGEKA